jgi:hypothetical protein
MRVFTRSLGVPVPSSNDSELVSMSRAATIGVICAIVCQIVLLIIAGWKNRLVLNPDGVAYILLASHYAQGEFNLAISGYWGPLLSWLLVPLLKVFDNPMDAARIILGLSALVFVLGSLSVYRSLQIDPAGIVLGTWIVAIASISWSVENVTPDLLMSGVICLAVSTMISPAWIHRQGTQLLTGMLFGTAYLAKAVALPLGVGMSIGIALLWLLCRRNSLKPVLRGWTVTLIGFVFVAAPWITVLSFKYNGLTITTSAKVAHAFAGPKDKGIEIDPHFNTFHTPEAGRISSWEEPTALPYRYWSPFESVKYFKYQLRLFYDNAAKEVEFFSGFDRFHLTLFAVLFGLLVHAPWRENMASERWRWAAVPILCIAGIYLPGYASSQRYYYPAYPFVFAASIGVVTWLTRSAGGRFNIPRMIGVGLISLSFFAVAYSSLLQSLRGLESESFQATYDLARKLQALDIYGGIAGAGDCSAWGGVYAEFVAFFMKQPFHGCEANPTVARVKSSGAAVMVVQRTLPLTADLDKDPSFSNLDRALFKSGEAAAKYPFKIYQMRVLD